MADVMRKRLGPFSFATCFRALTTAPPELEASIISIDTGDYIEITEPTTTPAPAAKLLPFPVTPAPASSRRAGVWAGTYQEYTAHPEFRRIAAQAKREWNYQCLMNIQHQGPIEMHHRHYGNVPFREDWRDLIPLCEDCHRRHHARLAVPPIGLFEEIISTKAA